MSVFSILFALLVLSRPSTGLISNPPLNFRLPNPASRPAKSKDLLFTGHYFGTQSKRQTAFIIWQLRSNVNHETSSDSVTDDSTSDWEEFYTDNENEFGDYLVSSQDAEEDPLFDEYAAWSKSVEKALNALIRKRDSLKNELTKAESVESTMRRAQLITNNMYLFTPGVKSATVQDWENDGEEILLTLDDSFDSASAEADSLYQQARKLKRGSAIVRNLLEETDESFSVLEEMEIDLKSCSSDMGTIDEGRFRLIQDRLIRDSRRTGFSPPSEETDGRSSARGKPTATSEKKKKPTLGSPASNVRKLLSPGGCIVLVGRNRRGNEYLSFSIARGDDIWMHARGCPGAHVVIQQRRGSPSVTDECIQYAADLAVFYSDARSERSFDVTSAEPKHILKPRGAPLGAVKLREERKTYTGYPDQVDQELVDAREESGQEDGFRFNDKAKNRRRTKYTAKQEQAKRRQRAKEKRKRKGGASS